MAFVPVTDLARAKEFYVGILGLELRHADDYGCMLGSNGTTVRLALVEELCAPARFTVLGWEVASVDAGLRPRWRRAAGSPSHRYEGMGQDDSRYLDRTVCGATASPGSPTARATPFAVPRRLKALRGMSPAAGSAVLFAHCGNRTVCRLSNVIRACREGRRQAQALADELRRLIRLSVSTAPSPRETAELTAQLAAVADRLEAHIPDVPLPRYAPPEDGPPGGLFVAGLDAVRHRRRALQPLGPPRAAQRRAAEGARSRHVHGGLRGRAGVRARRRSGGHLRHRLFCGQYHRRCRADRRCD